MHVSTAIPLIRTHITLDGSLRQPQMFTVSTEKLQFCPIACKFDICHCAGPVCCKDPQGSLSNTPSGRKGETTMSYVKFAEISLNSTVSPLVVTDTDANSLTWEEFAVIGQCQLIIICYWTFSQ